MNNSELMSYKAISDFTKELNNISEDNHSLKLYVHLLNKTTLSHDKAIRKHISIFRDFCIANRDGILKKDFSIFTEDRLEYSSRVFIDFKKIFNESDTETTNAIWKHFLTISALLDPAGKAKELLKKNANKEADFLSNIISKVENNVKPDSNPLEAVSSIMNSGIFNELISDMNSGLENGNLDLSKLMGTVQQMCNGLNTTSDSSEANEAENPLNMITKLMGNIQSPEGPSGGDENPMNMLSGLLSSLGGGASGGNSDNGGIPDLSNLTNLIGPMLSTLGGGNNKNMPSIEEISKMSFKDMDKDK
jgi:hypothetical protein